ncbi:UBP1-associated protein 2C [Dendrobium catenatum]|uniref:31 kDa ribonucleoprotein, chloroplastic n=1 Tax=Dendrobium catenatum TaxID=906689 RepID=A0A2I0W0E8_9ASPA|nr:UBP1-associated protein 2C [Dendrobium catenatum]PKU69141.1 31 kDa ribonucleoprotein, chloroplastic [Dendrobium catenatum]
MPPQRKESMEKKKRKLLVRNDLVDKEGAGYDVPVNLQSEKHLRSLLTPLGQDQLVELLVKTGMKIPEVAEEIRGVASTDPVHRKLFVRGLAWETTSETLRAAFSLHGEIEEGAVIVDKATGKSRGFGFITFKNMESTQKALEEPSKLIDGRLAVCNLACEGLSSASVSADVALRKVYVGGLSPDISTETLLSFFGKHGEIEEGSVAYDRDTNISRGFGFVTYKSAEVAKKAIADPNKILGGRSITVKLADTQHKGKLMQTQVPATVVPIAIPIPATYPQAPKSPIRTATAPVTYAPYLYSSPYVNPPSHYLLQSQVPYPHVSAKEPYGIPSPSPTGISGYPYYFTKH